MAPVHPRSKARNTKSKRGFSNNVPPGLHYLPPLDPRSEEFLELFRSFLMSKDERKTILELSDDDAKVFIEIIDRAFRAARLDTNLRTIALSVLRRLCGRAGFLPESYQLSEKFYPSEMVHASGGFSDVRKGVFKGKDVAVKSLRIAELDDKMKIRKRFCKEVVMWKNLAHPNVLGLIGVPDTLESAKFSMVSEWMANGTIIEYVRKNEGNHLRLLADAAEGLRYLHHANIVHGDLKGANILITNTYPVSACLADFGFMTIVHDPSLEMTSSTSDSEGGGTTPFMSPELLVPSKFGREKAIPTKEADIYAMGMVMYQVLTGTLPFGKQTGPEVVFKVLGGERPSKPTNALELGLSDKVWELLEECWRKEYELRPLVENVLKRVKSAASACSTLSPVGGVTQRQEDPQSCFNKFDNLFLSLDLDFDDEDVGPFSMERHPSQDSVTSLPESLFSKLSEVSEAETFITEPASASTDALAMGTHSKGESTEDLPAFLFSPAYLGAPADPISRPSTPGSEIPARPRFLRGNSGPYRFAGSNDSSRTILEGIQVPHQRDQPRSDPDVASIVTTAASYDRELHVEREPRTEPEDFSFVDVPNAATIVMAQAKDIRTSQLRRPTSMLSLRSSRSRQTESDASSQFDDNARHKSRHSRFHIRQRLGRVFEPIFHQTDTRG